MKYKYELTEGWIERLKPLKEFKSGGMQVTVKLNDGRVFKKVLVSNHMYIVAMRGHRTLPFDVKGIADIYQTEEDENPEERGNWDFWDDWS